MIEPAGVVFIYISLYNNDRGGPCSCFFLFFFFLLAFSIQRYVYSDRCLYVALGFWRRSRGSDAGLKRAPKILF
jgi:hypothetical protein